MILTAWGLRDGALSDCTGPVSRQPGSEGGTSPAISSNQKAPKDGEKHEDEEW